MAAAFGLVFRVETEVDEGVVGEGGGHDDVSATAAVAAGRAAAGDEFLTAEGHTAVATVASFDTDSCFIYKHLSVPSVREAGRMVERTHPDDSRAGRAAKRALGILFMKR